MQRIRRLGALTLTLAVETALVVGLARLGTRAPFAVTWSDPLGWLRAAEPVDALAALVRVAALVGAGWLLVITVACALVDLATPRAVAAHGLSSAVRRATPRGIRQVVDRALLLAVVGVAALPSSALAASTSVRDGRAAPAATAPPPTTAPGAATNATATRPPVAAVSPVGVGSPPATVTVAPGDNLWVIAAARLASATNRPRAAIGDAEIARYWMQLCNANRAGLRSGDVNLVFPGEVLVVPAITDLGV